MDIFGIVGVGVMFVFSVRNGQRDTRVEFFAHWGAFFVAVFISALVGFFFSATAGFLIGICLGALVLLFGHGVAGYGVAIFGAYAGAITGQFGFMKSGMPEFMLLTFFFFVSSILIREFVAWRK